MRNRIFRAVVIWQDGDVEDADDIQVFATSEAEAKREATKKWRLTVGLTWPHCKMREVVVRQAKAEAARPSAGGRAR